MNITVDGLNFKEIHSKSEVQSIIDQTADIIKEYVDYEHATFLILAEGGNWFAHRVLDKIDYPVFTKEVHLHSYNGEQRGELHGELPEAKYLINKPVIIIDDICDSGTTINSLISYCNKYTFDANAITLCKREGCNTLLLNDPLILKEGDWVIGCGMDQNGKARNLGSIFAKVD